MFSTKYFLSIRLTAVSIILLSIIVVVGWFLDISHLKSVLPGLNTMKFNTAICFFFSGVSLYLTTQPFLKSPYYFIFPFITFIIASCTFVQDLTGLKFGIDELIIKDLEAIKSNTYFPGRMAPSTAISFILLSIGLLSKPLKNKNIRLIIQYSLHSVSLISFIAIMGYLYNVPSFYKLSHITSMAIHTAISLFVLSITTTLLYPSIGFTGMFTGKEIGNIMAKRMFPIVLVAVVFLGFLRIEAHLWNFVSVEFGIALFALSFIIVALIVITNTANHLNRLDSKRYIAEDSLRELNKNLEQKIVERTRDLEDSDGKFFKVFQMSPTGLIISDLSTSKFLEVNQSFVDMLGYPSSEVVGKTSTEIQLVPDAERLKMRSLLTETGHLKNYETIFKTKSGELRNAMMSVELIEVGGKQIALTVLYDITKLKLAEQKLMEAKRLAEESSISKERFMANMSHEIRTPMNAIIGFTNLIQKSNLTDEQRQHIGFIQSSGENLLVLLNDILDYSKIEAGMMQFESTPFSITDILENMRHTFKDKIHEKGLDFETVRDARVPTQLIGDPTRLNQILINLLGNALKFTSIGKITIQTRVRHITDDNATIQFSIIDTGIGIETSKQKAVFERFTQATDATTRTYGGTGLGLSIVKNLVELQGGTIELESMEGKGTTFHFTLPFQIIKTPKKDLVNNGLGDDAYRFNREIRVLLVEDNMLNQVLAKKILQQFGCEVTIADNGEIAVETVATKTFDIVLMDIQMPVMDGYSASLKIREMESMKKLPIIAMTAHIMTGEREKCVSYGMNDYLSKPFKVDALFEMISSYVKN